MVDLELVEKAFSVIATDYVADKFKGWDGRFRSLHDYGDANLYLAEIWAKHVTDTGNEEQILEACHACNEAIEILEERFVSLLSEVK